MYLPEEAASISSGGEDQDLIAPYYPKKRAEPWTQEETRCLITFRREVDALFNTSKSNQHLWDLISAKMSENGLDRSPTMCTDKWRNLLKELKSPTPPKADSYILLADQVSGLEDASIAFGSLEAGEQSTVNLESQLEQDGDPLAITSADAAAATVVSPWNWRETPVNVGRVISVKFGEYTRRIGIDGTADAIKETIKAVFGLRTKRLFWLEDEDEVVRSLDRDMPLGNYVLHLDEGITVKLCHHDDPNFVRTEEKTLYTKDDFSCFLVRHSFSGLRELGGQFGTVDTLDDLQPGGMYRAVRLLED